jgi:MscS family membrane protein
VIDSVIENVTVEPARRVVLQLGLTYTTTPEQMEKSLDILKKIPDTVNEIEMDTFPYFSDYGDSSLNIKYIYFIKKNADIFEAESKVNLAILKQFNVNGLRFAYPTTTVYLEK